MMTCYLRNNKMSKCIALYQDNHELLDNISHLLALKACIKSRNYALGRQIITQCVEPCSIELLTTIIDFYGQCKDITSCVNIFISIPPGNRTVVTVGAMMKSYINNDYSKEAIFLYDESFERNKCNDTTHLFAIKACANLNDSERGEAIIQSLNHRQSTLSHELLNTIIDFYGQFTNVDAAESVFHSISKHRLNAININAMMTCYSNNHYHDKCLNLYQRHTRMRDDVSHLLAIKACINLSDFRGGKDIIDSLGSNIESVELLNTMIDFHGQMGDIDQAIRIFDAISVGKRNIVSMNVLMNAYCNNEMNTECIQLFEHVQNMNHIEPNYITFSIVLKAAIHETALLFGQQLHQYLKTNKEYHHILNHLDVQMNLICLYGKANRLDLCEYIFDDIKATEADKYRKEIKLWNAMMNAYGRNGKIWYVVQIFDEMKQLQQSELIPNQKTYCILLNACKESVDMQGIDAIQAICNEHILVIEDQHMDYVDIGQMSKAQLMDTLDVFKWKHFNTFIKDESQINNKEWTDNFLFQLKCDDNTMPLFKMIMLLPTTEHSHYIHKLINRLQQSFGDALGAKEYLSIITGYGIMGNTYKMWEEYKHMLSSGIKLNNDILICLLHHLMHHGEAQYVTHVWKDILRYSIQLNSLSLQLLILCVNKTANADVKILFDIWDVAVNQQKIKPNLYCYCLATLCFSKHHDEGNQKMAKKLLFDLESNSWMVSLLSANKSQLMQILNSYGNLGELDRMWSFYHHHRETYNDDKHDIDSLIVIASQEDTSMHLLDDILNIVNTDFNLKQDVSTNHLIFFHRLAIKCDNKSMQQHIFKILQSKSKIKSNVIAYFTLNNQSYSISTGYESDGCPFDSHDKVDVLMKEIDYKINTSICTELSSEIARQKHLKSHSEKKALAIVLKQEDFESFSDKDQNIKIKVGMKMCQDCHAFFCQVSKKYNEHNIQCVDPVGTHLFLNGVCQLCRSSV
eukprot:66025_1